MSTPPTLFSYRKHWAHRFGTAPFLPMSQSEMRHLGWDRCDIILVTGDAYIDHPSFGMAIIGRLLEAQGFRVGIIAQPDWNSAEAFKALGPPALFFGITAGNMDSMVNRYTSDRRLRHNDSYTPGGEGGRRPERSVIVYAQRCREAYREVPILLGGIEASLRRLAHYDYWSDKVRRSVLADAKADLLAYGNAERAVVEIAHRAARGERLDQMDGIRGTARLVSRLPEPWLVQDCSQLEEDAPPPPALPGEGRGGGGAARTVVPTSDGQQTGGETPTPALPRSAGEGDQKGEVPKGEMIVRLPSYEQVAADPALYAHAARLAQLESNPGNARSLVQRHGNREVWVMPPPLPLTTAELDGVFDLPYARAPHPAYHGRPIPAWEMIRFSVNIVRGCFGGCSFCSITQHEGRIIQSRSEGSILSEIEHIRDTVPGFTGIISDLGGPSANMYRLNCTNPRAQALCRRPSCLYPQICKNLDTRHEPLIALYRQARGLKGIKKVLVASGIRYDLAVQSPAYVRELVSHHVGGYLKVAPEHTEPGPLARMLKPDLTSYHRFKDLFQRAAQAAGKEYYLIPYFIAAHPGTTDQDMLALALWLKHNNFRLDQVQTFLPAPMALASAMYHSGYDPLRPIRRAEAGAVFSAKGLKQRRLHKAFLRWHDAENWPTLRDALKAMGRADLIGPARHQLVPAWQPAGTGQAGGEGARHGRKHGSQVILGSRPGQPARPAAPPRGRKP